MASPNTASLFNGFFRALVIDSKDPQFMGRVKVRIPDLMVDPVNTGDYCDSGIWAHPANNYLGGRNINDTTSIRCDFSNAQYQGSCLVPPEGSHVFVFFEKGDPNRPFYFGAAEYGQLIVPPENRNGKDYDKKWTLLKTNKGRTFFASDDTDDERVEITGKKRKLTNPPFGDMDSVFEIDDNQSVFLIDERKENEKIFIKDYRGNYIKMIQNEFSEVQGKKINDQLHVYFHDDIHIDTPKNIYITAGENIHIRAGNDIYINALHDMFIKAKNEFKEMAHRIDRYSETDDDRHADRDINDHATNVINRQGVNEINDISIRCTRNAVAAISDQSSGIISSDSGASTNVSSGGVISIMGSSTYTQTFKNPDPVNTACKIAQMTPDATPANPDKNRYQIPDPNDTDFPHQYQGNVTNPHNFKSKISNESQPYNTVVGGFSVDPYVPPEKPEQPEQQPEEPTDDNAPQQDIIIPNPLPMDELVADSFKHYCENLRVNDVAKDTFTEGITDVMGNACSAIAKILNRVNEVKRITIKCIKQVITIDILRMSSTMKNSMKTEWKKVFPYENDETKEDSTKYKEIKTVETYLKSIYDNNSKMEKLWTNFSCDGGELDKYLIDYENHTVKGLLYEKLKIAGSDKTKVLEAIDSVMNSSYDSSLHDNIFGKCESNINKINDNIKKSITKNSYSKLSSDVNKAMNGYTNNIIVQITKDGLKEYYASQIDSNILRLKDGIKEDTESQNLPNLVNAIINKTQFTETIKTPLCDEFNSIWNDSLNDVKTKVLNDVSVFLSKLDYRLSDYDIDLLVSTLIELNINYLNRDIESNISDYLRYCKGLTTDFVFISDLDDIFSKGYSIDSAINLVLEYVSRFRKYFNDRLVEAPSIDTLNTECKNIYNFIIIGTKSDFAKNITTGEGSVEYCLQILGQRGQTYVNDNEVINNINNRFIPKINESEINCTKSAIDVISDGSNVDADIKNELKDLDIDSDLSELKEKVLNSSKVCDGKCGKCPDKDACNNVNKNIEKTIKSPEDYSNDQTSGEAEKLLDGKPSKEESAENVNKSMDNNLKGDDAKKCAKSAAEDENNKNDTKEKLRKAVEDSVGGDEPGFFARFLAAANSGFEFACVSISKAQSFLDSYDRFLNFGSTDSHIFDDLKFSLPDMFLGDIISDTNKMLNDSTKAVSEMEPLKSTLVTLDNLSATIDGASRFVGDFVNFAIRNLNDALNFPGKLIEWCNDFIQDALNFLIGGLLPGSDLVNNIRDLASLKFLSNLTKMFEPILNIALSLSSLLGNLANAFANFGAFDKWNLKLPELKLDLTKLLSNSLFDCFSLEFGNFLNSFAFDAWNVIKDKDQLSGDDWERIDDIIDNLIEKQSEIIQDLDNVQLPDMTDDILNIIGDDYPTVESVTNDLNDVVSGPLNEVINSQKEIIENNIILGSNMIQNEFSEFNPINKLHSVPSSCGCGYEYMLFLKEKYLKTIPVLSSISGCNFISLSLLRDTQILENSGIQYQLMDQGLISEYNQMILNYNNNQEVSKNNKWWKNLNTILTQCEIYGIDIVMTIYDFKENSPFVDNNYVAISWNDDIQGKFLKDLCDFINYHIDEYGNIQLVNGKPQRRCIRCILNFGYGRVYNQSDLDDDTYPMYPTCGYLRPMIMKLAYDCNFSSNWMAITANEKENIYYYNPYSEWKSFDDAIQHKLQDYEITTRDYVDGKYNGEADIIKYDDKSKVVGGYCKFLIDCSKKSLPLMSMNNFSDLMNELKYVDSEGNKISVVEYYTNQYGEIHPNIMNDIYNPASRECLRYFKKPDYFKTNGDINFNSNGEVI